MKFFSVSIIEVKTIAFEFMLTENGSHRSRCYFHIQGYEFFCLRVRSHEKRNELKPV